jgi:hypothetical protein
MGDETKPLLHGPINADEEQEPKSALGRVKLWLKVNLNLKMLALLSVLIVIATANRVSFKVLTNSMDFRQSYLTFTNQVRSFLNTKRPTRQVFWDVFVLNSIANTKIHSGFELHLSPCVLADCMGVHEMDEQNHSRDAGVPLVEVYCDGRFRLVGRIVIGAWITKYFSLLFSGHFRSVPLQGRPSAFRHKYGKCCCLTCFSISFH